MDGYVPKVTYLSCQITFKCLKWIYVSKFSRAEKMLTLLKILNKYGLNLFPCIFEQHLRRQTFRFCGWVGGDDWLAGGWFCGSEVWSDCAVFVGRLQ